MPMQAHAPLFPDLLSTCEERAEAGGCLEVGSDGGNMGQWVCLSIFMPLSIYLSIYLSIKLSIYLLYLYIYLTYAQLAGELAAILR